MSTAQERAAWSKTYIRPKPERPASPARGVHHVALLCADVERTIHFYQDLLGGCVQHHGFTVAGDILTLSAYYQATQRLFAVMRALRTQS